ncbi:MAG TPA: hypothetical protein VGT78_08310 [Rhizomicrobium sp.]|nr:hypothetical protein [Rhizomicrobium sp.]
MSKRNIALLVAAIAISATPAFARKSSDPAGDKAMHDYVLTMPKVKAYDAATNALMASAKSDPSLKAEGEAMNKEPDKTFADLKAKIAHHPHYYAFFSKQGLSVDDTVLVPITLMSACSVVQYPQIAASMADTVSPSQITFCKQNMAQLKAMKFFNGGGDSGNSDQ